MGLVDKLKSKFKTEEVEAPQHLVADGDKKDWKASEFSEQDYVDDDWLRENTKVVE